MFFFSFPYLTTQESSFDLFASFACQTADNCDKSFSLLQKRERTGTSFYID